MKVYGPYTRKDGRKHVIIIDDDNNQTTVSYPKYLMQEHLGRQLTKEETVDHIDGDFTNDSIDNLQILSRKDNARKQFEDFPELKAKQYIFECPVCKKEAVIPYRRYKDNQLRQGKAGPYCSRSCAGKIHH